ncbi:plasmid pRiA4b ORF-3 family protein [Dactylosporangium sp. NPDC051541]|uniref:plasmid pRiA4b ORF-3 family protein n=1 Tax=Dactylosporangium sp. NPDC051541 TaxID=3363977 RepID=UPI0037929561
MTAALRDAADDCPIMRRARSLAGWVGDGRAVTPKGVLRPVDVAAAMVAMGLEAPERVRTAADVGVLHRAWVAALAAGFVEVRSGKATTGSTPGKGLEAWWAALQGQSDPALCLALLAVATGDDRLADEVHDAGRRTVEVTLELLAEFGAIDAGRDVTALGRWAFEAFAATAITADLSAAELLVRLVRRSEWELWEAARLWLAERDVDVAVRALLTAAEEATPAGRVVGVDLVAALGEAMRPVWRSVLDRPMLAAHARAMLAAFDGRGEAPSEVDHRWLAVEYALAAEDLEEAWYLVEDFGGLEIVAGSTHPGAAALLGELSSAGAPPQRVYQLKVVLSGVRPSVWRRLRVPGSLPLEALHYVLQAAFEWENSHLHSFECAGRRYSSPELDDCEDEALARLAKALPVDGVMTYVYDMGDWWEHRITVERVDELDGAAIACLDGRGDAPIEDSHSEAGLPTTPFDIAAINRRLDVLFAESVA